MSVLFEEALKLPRAERRKLADDIYDSLDASPEEVILTTEQRAELARRIEDYKRNPGNNYTWEEIEAEALAR